MEAANDLFPYGELEGASVLGVRIHSVPTGESLIAQALRYKQPGHRAMWIRGAPWGDLGMDKALLEFMSDRRVESAPIVAIRDLESIDWSQLNLYWIADASNFLGEPVTMTQLQEKILALQFYPQVREVILRQPPASNLKPSVLDELYAHLNPDGVGSIYCPPGDFEYRQNAMRQACRCATPWLVRFDHQEAGGGV